MKELSFTLFLDESGDSVLCSEEQYQKNPQLETHCTLIAVIIGNNKSTLLQSELSKIKKCFWRSDKVILHNVEIRHKQGAFAIFHYKPDLYEEFKIKMDELTNILTPSILCSSLDKLIWVKKYPRKLFFKDDPYEQAFIYLLERYAHFLNNQASEIVRAKIVAESRENKDASLRKTLKYLKEYGTQYNPKDFFRRLPDKIEFYNKKFNIGGLQISDYFSYAFYVNHKYPQRENLHYDFLKQFVYPGEFGNYGHKKWPV